MDKFVERLLPELLGPRRHERVLDIGCGTGNHLLFLNKLGLDINGIDASPYMIDTARKRLCNRCFLKTGMAEDLPFDDNEFDLAVLINTIEFLDNPLEALREAGRVTKRKIFVVTLNSLSWHCMYDKLHALFRDSLSRHIRPYSLWDIKSYVRSAFGPAPITWRSELGWPLLMDKICGVLTGTWESGSWPFGSFLGLMVKIGYSVKTDNLPLKVRVNKGEQPLAGGITTIGSFKTSRGDKRPIRT